ncbi:hypothetical protein [Haloarchaeobius baliensis]|uniref:hypothetical protein n=1 Tax=Haloarchaeobius baliensis TaxID=1670458 RepID=UPI003F881D6B
MAGVTGLGWTVSILAYLSTLLGYGNAAVARLVGSPRALLYLGGGLLVATLGLDRLQRRGTDDEADDRDGETALPNFADDQPE